MIWKLSSQTDTERLYVNEQTGSEVKTRLIYTDKLSSRWWGFYDLVSIPYIRKAFSQSIANLFQAGLSPQDLKRWIEEEKKILKSNDAEKYEKLYALVLEKETVISSIVDPLKQNLGLATIYVLADTERIDHFSYDLATEKLSRWKLDNDAEAFFLNWLNGLIMRYTQTFDTLSQIASNQSKSKNNSV